MPSNGIWLNDKLSPIAPPKPRETLHDRKRKFIATLDCQSLFDRLGVLDEEIGAGLTSVERTTLSLAAARGAMEMAEITACWEVEGKNETERKTRKAAALRDDAEYQASVRQVTELEGQKVEANLRLGNAQRQVRRVEHQIDYRIAVLRYLGE